LLALFGVVFPDDLEDHICIIGSNGGSDGFVFDRYLDESILVLAVTVKGEPVVQIFAADTPGVVNTL
jgi:hypothetical protein